MSTYYVTSPREEYEVKADSSNDARKEILTHEEITMTKDKPTEPPKPFEIVDIRKDLPFKNSNGTMNRDRIDTVVIHHDGQHRPAAYSSLNRYKSQAAYHIGKGYGHISYHYIIDNVGVIFRCLADDEIAYHCGNWWLNRKSIAVKFDGNMDIQTLTNAQIAAYKELMVYLTTKRPDMPKVLRDSVKGHKEIKATACPGRNTMPIIHNF